MATFVVLSLFLVRRCHPPELLDAIVHGDTLSDQGVITTKKIVLQGFNTVVKYGRNVRESEAEVMNFIREYAPSVPIQVLGTYQTESHEPDKIIETYIVSQWVDGENLEEAWDELSGDEKDIVFGQLREMVFRRLTPLGESYYVGGAGHKPCTDHIIFDQGPFTDISSFNTALLEIASPYFRWNWLSIVERSLARTNAYCIVFTHGDLHISNILVHRTALDDGEQRWGIAALIGWECAGWYPEHWEYVKALSSVRWRSVIGRLMFRIYWKDIMTRNS
ncbi:hypothetical protein SERLA73DRAFT_155939 [Serpula lacrymans var. lacrymans S7.3]|uniref:Aminoglycoside phosphotransferase domain-containing protein n=2 Tax=Serpula lacrymans var. lacrymans TaxID=341189 RepID=F8QC88_SERL3|nr:uncharacterized protein SERLADRAFT_411635 [Serpula lacrymans var. lacrymans S7.9]EGN94207.1 hypothetical protein SERLA73DRAFT_155939 [Serpula lacrymans var. lacrymans S7.3]EGO19631.1 hypothetical protein SERLADRAFT_411635 [Serpula lacrymans var. lacrymans S7.9]